MKWINDVVFNVVVTNRIQGFFLPPPGGGCGGGEEGGLQKEVHECMHSQWRLSLSFSPRRQTEIIHTRRSGPHLQRNFNKRPVCINFSYYRIGMAEYYHQMGILICGKGNPLTCP